jgi:hypothetical protein
MGEIVERHGGFHGIACGGVPSVPLLVLLLPRPLPDFLHRDQAEDLLRCPGTAALEPGRLRYGVLGRLPDGVARRVARAWVRRVRLPGTPRAVAVFHPFQLPAAEALLDRHPDAELWYSRWDRYESAYDARGWTRRRLRTLHERAARRSALTFAVSGRLAELEHAAGRQALVVGLAADSFPAPDPGSAVVGVSLGHLGRRTDWRLLREVAEAMPELVLLLIGSRHDDESGDDPDYAWCRSAPGLLWLGRRSDEEAARLILCADVGILAFEHSEFNDSALPYRILKYARLGRMTVAPDLAGLRTWSRAVVTARGAAEWVRALRSFAGARTRPDAELRAWAFEQTAATANRPLVERMRALGIPTDPQA